MAWSWKPHPHKKTHSGNLDIFSYVIASSDWYSRIYITVPAGKLAERLGEEEMEQLSPVKRAMEL